MKEHTEHIDITPDKSIFHKIGEANYSISDAIAELVDNSIDAANDDGVEVNIILDKKDGKIVITDNGRGMGKEVAAKALVLAHSKKENSLGEFGLGLKSACMSLGEHFKLTTTGKGSSEAYILSYDRDEFAKTGKWDAFPISVHKVEKDGHGTTVEISTLRVKLYDALVTRLKADLSQRYGPFINHNNVVIKVGLRMNTAKPCIPDPVELDNEGRRAIEYRLKNGSVIKGWWGLRKVASGTLSGFDLFRRGRLIRAAEKLGYNPHPMANHITGEIDLDPVPVTHNKREFITESGEFREFIENYWGDKTAKLTGERVKGKIDEILSIASERWNKEKVDKQLPDSLKNTVKDNILRALNRVDEFKELAFPNMGEVKRRSRNGEEAPMEARSSRVATEEPVTPSDTEDGKRTPHKTQPRTAKFIIINGRKFKFDFQWRNLGDDTIDKETVVTEDGVEIYINTGFKGFILSKDSTFYSIHHVAEALAQTFLRESGQAMSDVVSLRNKLIYQVASVVLEEEELKELSKREEELKQIQLTKNELLVKSRASSLK